MERSGKKSKDNDDLRSLGLHLRGGIWAQEEGINYVG